MTISSSYPHANSTLTIFTFYDMKHPQPKGDAMTRFKLPRWLLQRVKMVTYDQGRGYVSFAISDEAPNGPSQCIGWEEGANGHEFPCGDPASFRTILEIVEGVTGHDFEAIRTGVYVRDDHPLYPHCVQEGGFRIHVKTGPPIVVVFEDHGPLPMLPRHGVYRSLDEITREAVIGLLRHRSDDLVRCLSDAAVRLARRVKSSSGS